MRMLDWNFVIRRETIYLVDIVQLISRNKHTRIPSYNFVPATASSPFIRCVFFSNLKLAPFPVFLNMYEDGSNVLLCMTDFCKLVYFAFFYAEVLFLLRESM